jgi:shikimate dehydrogenase
MTHLLGVLGHPIAHSLSPRMHRSAIAALGADAAYLAIDVPPAELAATVHDLRRLGALGLNVTVPHKIAIVERLDAIDGEAAAIGAVNTIVREGERWIGTNTDARGLLRALEEAGFAVLGARVVVIGSGGAARAAAHGLAAAGAERVDLVARNVDRAWSVIASIEALRDRGARAVALSDRTSLVALFHRVDLVVQATSAPLSPSEGAGLVGALPIEALPDTARVLDLVYRPRQTAVLAAAEARGLRTIDGVGVLVHQGALALERWLAVTAPVPVMRRAVEEALGDLG